MENNTQHINRLSPIIKSLNRDLYADYIELLLRKDKDKKLINKLFIKSKGFYHKFDANELVKKFFKENNIPNPSLLFKHNKIVQYEKIIKNINTHGVFRSITKYESSGISLRISVRPYAGSINDASKFLRNPIFTVAGNHLVQKNNSVILDLDLK